MGLCEVFISPRGSPRALQPPSEGFLLCEWEEAKDWGCIGWKKLIVVALCLTPTDSNLGSQLHLLSPQFSLPCYVDKSFALRFCQSKSACA